MSILELAAGKIAASSRGQHQVPKTLGKAKRNVVSRTVQPWVVSALPSTGGQSGPCQVSQSPVSSAADFGRRASFSASAAALGVK